MVIREYQMKDGKPHKSTENRTTLCIWENTEKTHSKKRMTQANILGTISQDHTKTWTPEKKGNQYELNQTGMIQNGSKWTISNQQHKYD